MLAQQHGAEQRLGQAQADDHHAKSKEATFAHQRREGDRHAQQEQQQARHAQKRKYGEAPLPDGFVLRCGHAATLTKASHRSTNSAGRAARAEAPAALSSKAS